MTILRTVLTLLSQQKYYNRKHWNVIMYVGLWKYRQVCNDLTDNDIIETRLAFLTFWLKISSGHIYNKLKTILGNLKIIRKSGLWFLHHQHRSFIDRSLSNSHILIQLPLYAAAAAADDDDDDDVSYTTDSQRTPPTYVISAVRLSITVTWPIRHGWPMTSCPVHSRFLRCLPDISTTMKTTSWTLTIVRPVIDAAKC